MMICYFPGFFTMVLVALATLVLVAWRYCPRRRRWHYKKRTTPRFTRTQVTVAGVAAVVLILYWRWPEAYDTCACRSLACANRSVPHFWIGGGQKCGTTTMYGLLAKHPQILAPDPKEPGYFAWPSPVRLASEAWYVRDVLRFREACERKLVTFDATAYYLQWGQRVAANLLVAAPQAKIVLVFREPVARAMSWLQHMALKFTRVPNCLHYKSMDCCVQQSWFLTGVHHLGGSLYFKHLASWLSAGWTLDRIHVVRFEDIIERKDGLAFVYRGVLAFLGLDPHDVVANVSDNANRRSTTPYNVSIPAYRAMVKVVRRDADRLNTLLKRDFKWHRYWARQLAQCQRDGVCRVSLLPPPLDVKI